MSTAPSGRKRKGEKFTTRKSRSKRELSWLSLDEIDRWVPLMACQGVSEVARSGRGFLRQFREAGGDPDRLDPWWRARRNAFLARHIAQARLHLEPLFDGDVPTRRHLALIAWGHSPDTARLGRARAPRFCRLRASLRPMPKVRQELAGIIRFGLGFLGPAAQIARQLADQGSEQSKLLDELDSIVETGSNVAGRLEEWTDEDEDRFVGKAVKTTAAVAAAAVKRKRARKRAKKAASR